MHKRHVLRVLFIMCFLLSLAWTMPARAALLPGVVAGASAQACAVPVFVGTLQFSINQGDGYKAVPTYAEAYLRSITACPITFPVKLGSVQRLVILSDQNAMVVYSSPNGGTYYVHRAWQIFAISADQWGHIVGLLMPKGVNR